MSNYYLISIRLLTNYLHSLRKPQSNIDPIVAQDTSTVVLVISDLIAFLVKLCNRPESKRKFASLDEEDEHTDMDGSYKLETMAGHDSIKLIVERVNREGSLEDDELAPEDDLQVGMQDIIERTINLPQFDDCTAMRRQMQDHARKVNLTANMSNFNFLTDFKHESTKPIASAIIVFLMKLFANGESTNFLKDFFEFKLMQTEQPKRPARPLRDDKLNNDNLANNLFQKYKNLNTEISAIDVCVIASLNNLNLEPALYETIARKCKHLL